MKELTGIHTDFSTGDQHLGDCTAGKSNRSLGERKMEAQRDINK